MRWPVEVILDLLGSGMSTEEIIEDLTNKLSLIEILSMQTPFMLEIDQDNTYYIL